MRPYVTISVRRTPKDHTSDFIEKVPKFMASGAVHLMGNFAPGSRRAGMKPPGLLTCLRLPPQRCLITFSRCVFVVFNKPRQAKVCDLADEFMRHQDVGCAQVAMDVILRLDEGHAVRHLQGAAHSQTALRDEVTVVTINDCF